MNLQTAAQVLEAAGTDAPRLTAEALLAHVLGQTRTQVLAQRAPALTPRQHTIFAALIQRAARGEPLAYLTGRREFHGLDFAVDARVLVPRPETELLVDQALAFLAARPPAAQRVLDVGTGSGCIAVTVAVKQPAARVTAVELSADALAVARANAERHGVAGRITFIQSDLLDRLDPPPPGFDVVCANLPYIPTETARALPVAEHEPLLALDGGPDGLGLIRRLLADLPGRLNPGGQVLLEIDSSTGPAAVAAAQAAFPDARVARLPDLAGLDRIVTLTR